MVIQIAVGVCLGIVAAVFILKNWRGLISSLTGLLIWGAVVGVLVWLGGLVWPHVRAVVPTAADALLALIALVGTVAFVAVPIIAVTYSKRRVPALNALIDGTAPWNTNAHLPLRLLLMALIAVGAAILMFAAVGCVIWAVDSVMERIS